MKSSQYKTIDQVPLESFDAALVCTPDQVKIGIMSFLLAHGKHTLVEKPLFAPEEKQIQQLVDVARAHRAACYTAYNHRFEPHIQRLKALLDDGTLGDVYTARLFYGNGTALDIKRSPWRDEGLGLLSDLGSHLLDLVLHLFGKPDSKFRPWSANLFESESLDHVRFGTAGKPSLELEVTSLSWRNTFTVDVLCERGSVHINGLCKWGPSTFTVRRRVYPSGVPEESGDATFEIEYEHFREMCRVGGTNTENDFWINSVLNQVAVAISEDLR